MKRLIIIKLAVCLALLLGGAASVQAQGIMGLLAVNQSQESSYTLADLAGPWTIGISPLEGKALPATVGLIVFDESGKVIKWGSSLAEPQFKDIVCSELSFTSPDTVRGQISSKEGKWAFELTFSSPQKLVGLATLSDSNNEMTDGKYTVGLRKYSH